MALPVEIATRWFGLDFSVWAANVDIETANYQNMARCQFLVGCFWSHRKCRRKVYPRWPVNPASR